VLHLDPEHECDRARRVYESHLSRAKWMTEHGYKHLLRGGASGLPIRAKEVGLLNLQPSRLRNEL